MRLIDTIVFAPFTNGVPKSSTRFIPRDRRRLHEIDELSRRVDGNPPGEGEQVLVA